MAFGIDDALAAATEAIKLTTTIVDVIGRYSKEKLVLDLDHLIREVRVTAIKRIDEADLALTQFERMLTDSKVNIDQLLSDVIANTPFWRPFEQHRLSQIRKQFNNFADSIYAACDDIAALVRCHQTTQPMGIAISESAAAKHALSLEVANSTSLRAGIGVLRSKLVDQKKALTG